MCESRSRLRPGNCPAYLLAGGLSLRFGSDKALVRIADEVLLLSLRRSLVEAGHDVFIVADRPDRYAQLEMSCLVDRVAGAGPLSALATALEHRLNRGDGWLLLINCDQVLWKTAWFDELCQSVADALSVVTFVADDRPSGIIQPIPGLFHTRLLSKVVWRLSQRQLSLQGLIASEGWVGISGQSNPRDWSFNTSQELQQILIRQRKS
jgi:molybdenum cofactor guanylyltransferase